MGSSYSLSRDIVPLKFNLFLGRNMEAVKFDKGFKEARNLDVKVTIKNNKGS
jgi:hypothetical protein